MPRININEYDNTTYAISGLTNDNIVYVPGNMPKGEWRNPVLVRSIAEFEDQFGTYSPVGKYGKTYEYVRGLLLAGLPVLFRRIVAINQDNEDSADETKRFELKIVPASAPITTTEYKNAPTITLSAAEIINATDAEAEVKLTVSTTENWKGKANITFMNSDLVVGQEQIDLELTANTDTDKTFTTTNIDLIGFLKTKFDASESLSINDVSVVGERTKIDTVYFCVEEKTGGTWGNNLSVTFERVGNSEYASVKLTSNNKELERVRILTLEGYTEDQIKTKELEFLKTHEFENIIVTGLDEYDINDEESMKTFQLPMNTYQLSGGVDIDDEDVIKEIPNSYKFIYDKYIYDVKFVTGGGYADEHMESPDIASGAVNLATTRKDCFAVIDFPKGTVKTEVTKWFTQDEFDTSFAAAFAPWCYIKLPSGNYDWMAPSYMFLYTLGLSVKAGNPVYTAPAGVLKASMPQVIKPEYEIGGDLLDYWQGSNPQSINPLMKLRNYGYVIYGQRTLYNIQNKDQKTASALQQINVRLAINEIRRILFDAAIRLTFQANNQKTWNEFKSIVNPKLDAMVSNGGITDYLVQMDETTTTEEDIQNNTIRARVKVSITKAVENFEIDFYVEPQSITFSDDENEKNIMLAYSSKNV